NKLLFHCCICFLVLFSETLSAQKVNQHTLYQQAQVAFENEAYSDALHYISQLRRVHKNQDYLRLKIQSQFYSINKFSAFDSYDEIVSLKEDVAHYLHNFDTSPDDEIHAIHSRL